MTRTLFRWTVILVLAFISFATVWPTYPVAVTGFVLCALLPDRLQSWRTAGMIVFGGYMVVAWMLTRV